MNSDEMTPTQRSDLMVKLGELRMANAASIEDLVSAGGRIDPLAMVLTRLNTLLDMALTPDQRLLFDVQFEQSMKTMLNESGRKVREAKLTQGIQVHHNGQSSPVGGGLILPGV